MLIMEVANEVGFWGAACASEIEEALVAGGGVEVVRDSIEAVDAKVDV